MEDRIAMATPHTHDALTTSLLTSGVVGGLGFPAIMLAAGAVREDYSALQQPGSMLSLGPDGWVQITNFVVTGLLMIAFAAGLRRVLRSGRGATWGPILAATYGVGLVGSGLFSADPSYGYPPGAPLGPAASFSVHGMLHEVAGYMVFGPLLASCFVFARRFAARADRRGWAAYSLLTGLVIAASIAGAFREWSGGNPANFGGLFQRMAIVARLGVGRARGAPTPCVTRRQTPHGPARVGRACV